MLAKGDRVRSSRLLTPCRLRRGVRGFVALVALPLFILMVASPAQAHPTLLKTLPQAGYSYDDSPVEIGLIFDEPVAIQKLTVRGQARGFIASTKPLRSPDGTKITVVPKQPLADGNYTVRWQITAEDGDIVSGMFGFAIGTKSTAAAGASGSTSTVGLSNTALLRWLLFSGFALAWGGLLGDSMVRDRARRAQARFGIDLKVPKPWILGGALLGLLASVGLLFLEIGQGSIRNGIGDASLASVTGSTAGRLLLVEAVGFLIAVLAALRPYRWLAGCALLPVLLAEAWRSHVHAAGGWLGIATIGVHLLVAALWVGVLIHIVRAVLRWRGEPRQRVALFRRYAGFAFAGYLIVVATGILAAILVLPSVGALASTDYGKILLLKTAAVVLLTIFALAARRGLQLPISKHEWGGLRFARAERIGLVAVLGVTAFLTASSPSPTANASAYPPPIEEPALYLGQLAGQISTGLIASEGNIQLRLNVPETDSSEVPRYRIRGTIIRGTRTAVPLKFTPCGVGCFTAPQEWPHEQATVALSVRAAGFSGGNVKFVVPWPQRDGDKIFSRMLDTMAKQPAIVLNEEVTSNTNRPEGMTSRLRISGAQFLTEQPYRAGIVNGATARTLASGNIELNFALSAEDIYVHMLLDPSGRILAETTATPKHLIDRTFTYPTASPIPGK